MIRAILFDLDGTLVDRSAAHRRYVLDLLAGRPEVFASVSRDEAVRFLGESLGRDGQAFARRVAPVFPGLGTAAELATDHARRLARFVAPEPEVVGLLERLRQRYVLGVVSNGAGATQRAKLEAAGLARLVGRAFISGEERAAKPHPRIFRRALAWAGTDPFETLFVGDDPGRDIAGAARVGMPTCWVSGGRQYPAATVPPGFTIEAVARLAEVLP